MREGKRAVAPAGESRVHALAGRSVLVTGGGGLIGSRITARLRTAGARAVVLDRLDAYEPGTLPLLGVDPAEPDLVAGDITDRALVRTLLAESDAVVHAAAYADVAACTRNPGVAFESNVRGTQVLLEEVVRSPVRRLVFASSASVYGDRPQRDGAERRFTESQPLAPLSVYGNSKAWAESQIRLMLADKGVEHTILRYFSVYGDPQVPKKDSHSWVVAWFAMHAAVGHELQLHNGGRQVRDFVHVDDVADATVRALCRPEAADETLNIGTGVTTSIRTVAELVREYVADVTLAVAPRPEGDPLGAGADARHMARVLGWRPAIGLEEGIRRYVEWLARTPSAVPAWLSGSTSLTGVG
nr:NAD-dependent epimerase/dehydratase family protein [Streptomyces sulphureus]